jgi:NADP-dependent 3-hydroxy acid dehydrogenase YdfG
VAEAAAVEAMIARVEAELGPVTILVNNAGVAWQGTLDTYDRERVARMRWSSWPRRSQAGSRHRC